MAKKKFAIWVSEYGIIQVHFVEANDVTIALNEMMDVCRRLCSYPGSMHILKIMEVENDGKR